MKFLLLPILFCATAISAQESDSIKMAPKSDILKAKPADTAGFKRKMTEYKILVSKPEKPSMYSSLKVEKNDSVQYKILNSTPIRKEKKKN